MAFIVRALAPRVTSYSLFVPLMLFLCATACYRDTNRHVIKISKGEIPFSTMIEEISSSRIIFVGESHDNPHHHKTQLDVIKALHEKGIPLSIALEMFTARDQEKLDTWVSGKMTEKDFIPIFYKNWGVGWGLYKDIFLYAREQKIPLIGLNVPREISRKVAKHGFQYLTREERSALPPGITCEVDQKYRELIRRVFEIKEHTDESFTYFCEAQVLWDQTMAWHLARYIEKNPKYSVVVLAGTIHSWKYGIPRQLHKFITVPYKVILHEVPAGDSAITLEDADYRVSY